METLEHFRLGGTSDRRLSGAAIAACKPDPAIMRRAVRRLRAKTLLIAAFVFTGYFGLMFLADGPLLALPLAAMLVVGLVATGTGVMHDANHGAFGRPRVINRTLAFTADVLGASSWFWRHKHNGLHHGNTNVVGVDTDIEQMPFARLAPSQPWRQWHRFQHIYMWPLYGFMAMRMLLTDVSGLLGRHESPRRPSRRDVIELVAGKLLHIAWAIAIPMVFHPWWLVLSFYLCCSWAVGLILALFFQLAHCNDLVAFAESSAPRRGHDFYAHQLETTANVHTSGLSRPVGWLMGGLNHQIEHHLAPGVPHPAYPAMADCVQHVCATHDITYHVHPSLWAAVRSHTRWLYRMGRRPSPPTDSETPSRRQIMEESQ